MHNKSTPLILRAAYRNVRSARERSESKNSGGYYQFTDLKGNYHFEPKRTAEDIAKLMINNLQFLEKQGGYCPIRIYFEGSEHTHSSSEEDLKGIPFIESDLETVVLKSDFEIPFLIKVQDFALALLELRRIENGL